MVRVLTLVACLFLFLSPPPGQSVGKVRDSAGAAVLLRGENVIAPATGTPLEANDIVRTEKGGSARLVLTDGSALLLGENTELRVTQHDTEAQRTSVELLHGNLLSQNTPVTKPGGQFVIRTPTAVVVALGTSLDVQTAGPSAGSAIAGDTQLALQDNGQPLAGADVALVLANMNKVSIGRTDEEGNPNSALELANDTAATPALDLANLGKAPLHAEVDECSDGTKQVYLIGPDGKLPPPAPKCKRKRLEGVFYWGRLQRVMLDVGRGTSVATDIPSAAMPQQPASPKNLSDIPAGTQPSPNTGVTLGSYTSVTSTVVTALDHFVGVANFDPQVTGVTYLLPGQRTFVDRGQQPADASLITDQSAWQKFSKRLWRAEEQHIYEIGFGPKPQEFDETGRPCEPGLVVDGRMVSGMAAFHYKITGLGTSTGNALQLQVNNDGNCPLYFLVTDGTIFHPKGFTEHIVTGILFGSGVPSLKDFQKMISMGGFLRVAPMGVLGSGPLASSGGEATMPLRSYCVELHKLAPHPKTEYRFGDEGDQKQLGTNRHIVDHTFSMVQTGALKVPPGHSMDAVIQWSLWSKIEGMDEKKFQEELLKLLHKNYDAQKKKWDKDTEKQMIAFGGSLWQAVQTALR